MALRTVDLNSYEQAMMLCVVYFTHLSIYFSHLLRRMVHVFEQVGLHPYILHISGVSWQNCRTVKLVTTEEEECLTYPSDPNWCCCHAAMEPREGPAEELKPDSSALLRE